MSSKIEIINFALTLLGLSQTTSPNEDNTASVAMNSIYDTTLYSMLTLHKWGFSVRRKKLEASTSFEPEWGYTYSYPLPADCIKLIQVGDKRNIPGIEYYVEDRNIITDASDILILYSTKDINIQHASPLFTEAFAAKLATNLSTRLPGRTSVTQVVASLFASSLALAIQSEDTESNYVTNNSEWLSSRHRYSPL